jgi:spermidine synthase
VTGVLVAGAIYLLFFLSGAAALTYQVGWVRCLTVVFGGSHLAVTAVLSTFMAGQAIGGYALGRRVDRVAKPLRLYGLLELGIAAGALLFEGMMSVYPSIYVALAGGRDDAPFYLTAVRMLFSAVALIVPTTLLGGTLPVISRVVCRRPEDLRRHLSFLYGFNTLGAVLGSLISGFFLLRFLALSTTLHIAVAVNVLIGVVVLLLPGRGRAAVAEQAAAPAAGPVAAPADEADEGLGPLSFRLVLWGIGLSGFCALGYEVLWTRVLTVAIGASVYGFTIILVAFLTGIAFGSEAYGVLRRIFRKETSTRRLVAWFGTTQLMIGITALLVTVLLRNIPAYAVRLQQLLLGAGLVSFRVRTWAYFALAFLYMVVPALFMGAAFPLAGEAVRRRRLAVGRTVGDVLSANTVGSILGAAVSGLVLIRLFGIERSLQILALVNAGVGLAVLASLRKPRWLVAGVGTATAVVLLALALNPGIGLLWDRKYFAIFRSNQPEAFATPELVREAVDNTDVLYYAEGVESTVSVIRVKGAEMAFLTNGRVEASSHLQAQQNQYTLGHLPVLLARDPRDVLVVGMGSGMTAGATAVHPGVERVTVAEIEPKVVGVARAFEAYNHRVLDNPKVRVVLNDGRNFLMTTPQRFDVITADPIHPWFKGASYLYASEYFALAAAHLKPGGVIAQWLPIYELTPDDLRSVVRTFQQHFAHTMMWLDHYDAALVGSAEPFAVDEAEIERRIAEPAVAGDLKRVEMGSAADLLGFFVMGTEGMTRFGRGGTLNTDDQLYLEFSAPFSIATPSVMGDNVDAIDVERESLLPYLKPADGPAAREAQSARWSAQFSAGKVGDRALSRYLGSGPRSQETALALRRLNMEYPWYAPGKFLWNEYQAALALDPRALQQTTLMVAGQDGGTTAMDVSAVLVPVSRTRASVMFVDNPARVVYGQVYIDNWQGTGMADRLASDVVSAVRAAYDTEAATARQRGQALPSAAQTLRRVKAVIGSKLDSARPGF